ncbi:hypothetical protein SFRURICE_002984, partial [Spodoptera frugiperda]
MPGLSESAAILGLLSNILAALAVSLGPFAAGLSKGYMSPAIASMQDTRPHDGGFTVSDQQASWIASLSLLVISCGLRVSVHRPTSYALHAFAGHRYASHVGIADDAVRMMRISGRSCTSFFTRQTKIRCVRCVLCGPVDAYLKSAKNTSNYKSSLFEIYQSTKAIKSLNNAQFSMAILVTMRSAFKR